MQYSLASIWATSKKYLDEKLGRCPTCMKTSFLSALISLLALLVTVVFVPVLAVQNLVMVVAFGLTALWLLHLIVYTKRIAIRLRSEYIGRSSLPFDKQRRGLLWVCSTALTIGVLASVWLPTSAFARGQKCGKGYCPDDAKNCCSRSQGKCCDVIWACTKTGTCFSNHTAARKACGITGIVMGCG